MLSSHAPGRRPTCLRHIVGDSFTALWEVCRWPVDDPPRGVWLISWCPTRLTLSSVVVQPASGSRHSSSPCFSLFPGLVEVQPSRLRRATPRSSDLDQLLRRVPRNADPGARSRHLGHDSRSPRQQVAPPSAPESLAPGAQREAAFISAACARWLQRTFRRHDTRPWQRRTCRPSYGASLSPTRAPTTMRVLLVHHRASSTATSA